MDLESFSTVLFALAFTLAGLFAINRWTELFTFEYTLANFLICGCVGSGTSYLLSMLVDDFGLKINGEK